MKFINKYSEFSYEGFVTNLIGKMFRELLNSFNDKDFTNGANNAISAIEKSKSIKELPNIIKKTSDAQIKTANEIKDIKGVSDFIKKDISLINMLLKTASKKYGMEKLSPNILYKDSNNKFLKETFMVTKNFKKDQEFQSAFQQNLDNNVKKLLIEIGKKSGIPEEEINAGSTTVQESKIYEGVPAKPQDAKKVANFKKLVEQTKLLHNSLYQPLIKKINEESAKVSKVGNFDEFAKTVKATKNVQSVKTMINKFAQLDKPRLTKVRDAQGLTKDNTPL